MIRVTVDGELARHLKIVVDTCGCKVHKLDSFTLVFGRLQLRKYTTTTTLFLMIYKIIM